MSPTIADHRGHRRTLLVVREINLKACTLEIFIIRPDRDSNPRPTGNPLNCSAHCVKPQGQAASAFFDHIWSGHDSDLWPFRREESFEPQTSKTERVREPTLKKFCVRFGWNPFVVSRVTAFTGLVSFTTGWQWALNQWLSQCYYFYLYLLVIHCNQFH